MAHRPPDPEWRPGRQSPGGVRASGIPTAPRPGRAGVPPPPSILLGLDPLRLRPHVRMPGLYRPAVAYLVTRAATRAWVGCFPWGRAAVRPASPLSDFRMADEPRLGRESSEPPRPSLDPYPLLRPGGYIVGIAVKSGVAMTRVRAALGRC